MTATSRLLVEFVEATRLVKWHRFLQEMHDTDFTHDIHDPYTLFENGGLLFESKAIVSNMPEEGLEEIPTKGHTPASWTHASYKQDFSEKLKRADPGLSPEEVDARAHKMADESLDKQSRKHKQLTGIIGRMLPKKTPPGHPEGYNIVGVGSGQGHEQAFKHEDLEKRPHTMTGHDFLPQLIKSSNYRNKGFGIKNAKNFVWSAYDVSDKGREHPEGSKEREDAQVSEVGKLQNMPASKAHPEDYKERMQRGAEGLPGGEHNIGYAKHACGGITDTGLKKAVQDRYHGFVTNTCCSHRLTGVSHEIIAKHHGIPWKNWLALVKASGNLPNKVDTPEEQAHDAKRSRMAQLAIDHYRKKYLEDHGYLVHQGWMLDEKGNPEAKGGLLAAARKDVQLHPRAHEREHVFKGIALHDHEPELKEVLSRHAQGDWSLGKNSSDLRKERRMAEQQKKQKKARESFVTGKDLLALGVEQGKMLGRMLGEFKKRQAAGEFSDREAALAAAKKHVESMMQKTHSESVSLFARVFRV